MAEASLHNAWRALPDLPAHHGFPSPHPRNIIPATPTSMPSLKHTIHTPLSHLRKMIPLVWNTILQILTANSPISCKSLQRSYLKSALLLSFTLLHFFFFHSTYHLIIHVIWLFLLLFSICFSHTRAGLLSVLPTDRSQVPQNCAWQAVHTFMSWINGFLLVCGII